jgi:hypothetical protein
VGMFRFPAPPVWIRSMTKPLTSWRMAPERIASGTTSS